MSQTLSRAFDSRGVSDENYEMTEGHIGCVGFKNGDRHPPATVFSSTSVHPLTTCRPETQLDGRVSTCFVAQIEGRICSRAGGVRSLKNGEKQRS